MKKLLALVVLGFLGSGVYGAWWLTNRYDLPKDEPCLWIEKGDIDGDYKEETIALSIEDDKPVIWVLNWQNSPVFLGKIEPRDLTGFIVGDVDKDNKAEIIISFCKEIRVDDKEKMEGWIEVWGWDGYKIAQEYKSNDLFGFTTEKYPHGILLGLCISDVDNDSNKEIAIGMTKPNQGNMAQTEQNFDPGEDKWGSIVGPLVEASIVRLEWNGFNYNIETNSIGDGLVYRLSNGPGNKITGDVFDLNYTNVNTLILGLATFDSQLDGLYKRNVLDILEKNLEQSEALKELFTHISPLNRIKAYKKIDSYLEKAKKKAGKRIALMATKAKSKYESETEKPLPDIPNIPGPLFETRIKIFAGSSFNSSTSIGMINLATKISNDKILVKPIELNYTNINTYINTLNTRDSLLYVKEEWHEDGIDQYTGTWWKTRTDYSPKPKELPQIPGRFLSANLQCFNGTSRLWKSEDFGPFNPDLVIDGDKAVVGMVDLDITKLNAIILHIDQEIKKWRQDEDGYEIQIPSIPDGLIYSKIAGYNISNGSKAYESPDLGILLFGLDKIASIGGARTTFDWTRLNNFIDEMNIYNTSYEARYKTWREDYFKPYFEKNAKVVAHRNVASLMEYYRNHPEVTNPYGWTIPQSVNLEGEDINNNGKIDTYPYTQVFKERGITVTITSVSEDVNGNGVLDNSLDWPSWPNKPEWDGPKFDASGITQANLIELNQGVISWQSQRLGDLALFVKNQNTGITTSAYDFDQGICSILLFTPSTSSKASLYGKVLDSLGNPIFATKTTLSAISNNMIKGTASVGGDGDYQIVLDPGTYTLVVNTDGPYLSQTKTITLNAGEVKEVNFILIPTKVSVSGRVMDKNGKAIEGATVVAEKGNEGWGVGTNEKGEYRIPDLKPGIYKVSAWKEGYSRVFYELLITSDLSGIDFYLPGGGGIAGFVYDKNRKPVEGAEIEVWGYFGWGTAVSDSNGNFAIPNLSAGVYEVCAKSPDGVAYLNNILVKENEITNIDIFLKPIGRIEGRVDLNGLLDNGNREYLVVAFERMELNADNLWDVLDNPAGFGEVDPEDGSFAIEGITPGVYNLYLYEGVSSNGKIKRIKKMRTQENGEFYITLLGALYNIPVKENEITDCGTLTPSFGTSSISGKVDTDDGGSIDPEYSIACLLNKKGELLSASPIDSGKYKMADINEGIYIFLAIARGYVPYLTLQTIKGTITKDITLSKEGGTIKGVVTDGVNPLMARVSIEGMGICRSQITERNGKYEFKGLIAGPYSISANALGYGEKEEDVGLKQNETIIINFELEKQDRLSSISGGVSAGGNPIQNAFVFASSPDDKGFASTDKNGSYTITNLKSGTYTLIAIAEGYKVPAPQELFVSGTITGINFALSVGDLRFGFGVMPIEEGAIVSVKTNDRLTSDLSYSIKKDGIEKASGTAQSITEYKYLLTILNEQIKGVEEITIEVSGTGATTGYASDSFVFGMELKVETDFSACAGGKAGISDAEGTGTDTGDNSKVEVLPGSMEGTETVTLVITKTDEEPVEKNLASSIYEVEISGAALKEEGKVILTLSYDPAKVKNPSLLCVYRKVENGWKKVGKILEINFIECTVKVELTKENLASSTQGLGVLQEGEGGSFGVFEEGAEITISPSSGYLGTIITVKGTGFDANETIQIDFGTTMNIKEVQADSQGSFTTTFTASAQTPGTITITATGKTSEKFNCALFYFVPQPSIISISPNSGINTGTIATTISGENFFGTPSISLTKASNIQANNVSLTGTTTISCIFDLTDQACGLYSLVVTNPDSQQDSLENAFYIFAPMGTYNVIASSTTEIGAGGGKGTISGASIELPPNALSSTQSITIAEITDVPPISGFDLARAISLSPHGLLLFEPATLTVKINPNNVVYINYGGQVYEPVTNFIKGTDTIIIPIQHFSFYFFGTPTFASNNNNAIVYP
ncbi:MAG: carboxypeptidase regulatory-like domain-containing protein, partial [bacterium]